MVMQVLYLLVVWVSSVLSQCCSDICCSVCAVHLWRYRGGYPALTECLTKLNNNKVGYEVLLNCFLCYTFVICNTNIMFSLYRAHFLFSISYIIPFLFYFFLFFFILMTMFYFPQEYLEFRKERAKMLISRRNQLLLEFSFWNEPLPRPGPCIYEMRTYHLKVT